MAMDSHGNTDGSTMPDEHLRRVGRALGAVSAISESYAERIDGAATTNAKQALLEEAERAAVAAVGEHGISVEEYNETITSAEDDPELQRRLVAAAQAA